MPKSTAIRLSLVVAVVIAIAGAVLIGRNAWHQLNANGPGSITTSDYKAITFTDSRSTIIRKIGAPAEADAPYPLPANGMITFDLGPPPDGSRCDYYDEAQSEQDAGVLRFCYVGTRLVEKASYDIEGPAPQEICVWHPAEQAPECRAPQ